MKISFIICMQRILNEKLCTTLTVRKEITDCLSVREPSSLQNEIRADRILELYKLVQLTLDRCMCLLIDACQKHPRASQLKVMISICLMEQWIENKLRVVEAIKNIVISRAAEIKSSSENHGKIEVQAPEHTAD